MPRPSRVRPNSLIKFGLGTFNLLVYADKKANVPAEWIDSDPKYIRNPEQVKLRSFSTGIHKVETLVCYKYDEDEL
jgi:mitotic spindle assembly checkpoint protein MAD2